jgi:hypothetical protein
MRHEILITRVHTAVDNSGTRFVVLLLGAPQVLEGAKGSQDRTTDPDGVFTLRGSNDLDLQRVLVKIS